MGIVGDMHGNTRNFVSILNEMGKRKITHVFVVGDFGLWTHKAEGHEFLDAINAAAEGNNLSIFAVGGNHENWDHWNWVVENMPTHKGFAMIRRRVLLAPKAHHFKLAGKQFVVAGGAVSIDKGWRLQAEAGIKDSFGNRTRNASGPRTLWWPDEELTDVDVKTIQSWGIKADILLTHDCSNYTQFKNRLKPDVDSERHRRRIDKVLRATKPAFHFHGHMHEKYAWINSLVYGGSAFDTSEAPSGPETQTYGFECDGMWDNWGVFDTETDEFAFRGLDMQFRSIS